MPGRDGNGRIERDLLELSELGGELVAPSPALRHRLLATVSGERRFEGFVSRVAAFLDFAEQETRALLAKLGDVSRPPWEDGQAAGVRLLHFAGGARIADTHCGLVSVAPGATYPLHRHEGDEWSFALQGTAREDSGRVWAPGDVVRNAAGSEHRFQALGPEPFVFIAVLYGGIEHLDGSLRYRSRRTGKRSV